MFGQSVHDYIAPPIREYIAGWKIFTYCPHNVCLHKLKVKNNFHI